jgi:DNA-binding MarR family transcriptional regulator
MGEGLSEERELAKAVERAAEAIALMRRRAERHHVEGVVPKRQTPLFRLEVGGAQLEVTDKQAAALLVVKGGGGVEALNAIARATGLNSKLALGLARQLEQMGLVKLVAAPQRKVVVLTPLGREVAEKVERELEKRGLGAAAR